MAVTGEAEPKPLLTLLSGLRSAVVARWRLALLIFAGLVGAGMTVTLMTPPSYESSIKILVARERVDPRVSPGAVSGEMPRAEISEEEFNSEMEIVRSREVVEAVAKELGVGGDREGELRGQTPSLRARVVGLFRTRARPTGGAAELDRAASQIAGNLSAVSVRKSRVISVTYRDRDPERAARVLNTLYEKYAEHHIRLHESSQAADVFRHETDAFSRKLAQATEELKRFDAQSGVISAESQKDLLLRQFYDTQSQANAARTELQELGRRIDALKSQLAAQPERIETGAVMKYVNALDKMKEELLQMELQHTALAQKYQPSHRLVRELEQRIAQARGSIAREEANPPRERSVALNEVHRRLLNDLLASQTALASVREREKRLTALTTEQHARVIELDRQSFTRAELERARAVNEEAYLLYHKKAQEAEISRSLDREKVVNVSLAEAARPAAQPVSPKPMTNFVVLCAVGLLAALAGAVAAEKLNPLLRHEDEVRSRYKIRVLARIPEATG
jgi:uncharacterized protein involved in exopolysaccharide biosynthesis